MVDEDDDEEAEVEAKAKAKAEEEGRRDGGAPPVVSRLTQLTGAGERGGGTHCCQRLQEVGGVVAIVDVSRVKGVAHLV